MYVPIALQYGISIFDYWNMTIKEINQFIKSTQLIEKQKIQEIYLQASLQANFVGYILNGEKIPPIQDVFPEIYQEEIELDRKKREENEAILFGYQMMAWAKAHNEQWRAKHKKDGENN